MVKILAVDDEEAIIELLTFNLEKEGHQVIKCYSGEEVLPLAINEQPEIILLDLMLPGSDGFKICTQLRNNPKTFHIPIIMLTAKADEINKILGLEFGADDYVTKPFSPRELIARIKALLRRRSLKNEHKPASYESYKAGDLKLIPECYQAYIGEELLNLSLKEYELLKLLIASQGRVLRRDFILTHIWGYDYTTDTRTVDVHMSYLRQKLGDFANQYIETIRGIGYRFKG